MPPFPKPSVSYLYDVDSQVRALRRHEETAPGRGIPDRAIHGAHVAALEGLCHRANLVDLRMRSCRHGEAWRGCG